MTQANYIRIKRMYYARTFKMNYVIAIYMYMYCIERSVNIITSRNALAFLASGSDPTELHTLNYVAFITD